MRRQNRRSAAVLLLGAVLSAAPMGLATAVSPAIGHAECAPAEGTPGDPAQPCNEAQEAPAQQQQFAIDPNLTPAENLVNLQKLPPPQLNEPLVRNSLVEQVPIAIEPTLGLPGVGFGVNLWPDLTPFVPIFTGGALVGSALPPPPDLSMVGNALRQLPPPQLPPPPPRPGPLCGPQITPFFKPCI
ncbi:MAG: hypothetical protein WBB07_23215 [Mycobacterium sp.]